MSAASKIVGGVPVPVSLPKAEAPRVAIAATGAANLASVLSGLRNAGAEPWICGDADEYALAPFAVLPGVGAFGPARAALAARGMDRAVIDRARRGAPTLAICLGMQLCCEESEEAPGIAGLSIVPGTVRRYSGALPVPQLGWNQVLGARGAVWPGWAYFANSYRLEAAAPGFEAWTSVYGESFVAALARPGREGGGGLLLCQFHPELSGPWGRELLRRWLGLGPGPVHATLAGSEDGPGSARGPSSKTGAIRVIPCLDLRDGRVVKGTRFEALTDAGDPQLLAARYEAEGADEIALLDITATLQGRETSLEALRLIRARVGIPLLMGGGLRTEADAAAFIDAGADRVAVNSAAVGEPALISALARRFGRQCVVLAIDAALRGDGLSWTVRTQAGRRETGIDVVLWAKQGAELGAGEILLTSIDRDGTGSGFDLALVGAVSRACGLPVIASGGAGRGREGLKHFADAARSGARAVLAAGVFHRGELSIAEVKRGLESEGIGART